MTKPKQQRAKRLRLVRAVQLGAVMLDSGPKAGQICVYGVRGKEEEKTLGMIVPSGDEDFDLEQIVGVLRKDFALKILATWMRDELYRRAKRE